MIKTKGIILRTMKYRETSLIVDIYTQELGLRSYIVNGVRTIKSKSKANVFQPMSQLELTVYDKNGPEKLNRIGEYRLHKFYEKIPFDVIRSMIGQLMIEMLRKCVKDEEANYEMYDFIEKWFLFLDESPEKIANLIPLFMVELVSMLGFAFSIDKSTSHNYFDLQEGQFVAHQPEHRHYIDGALNDILYQLILRKRTEIHDLKITNQQRTVLIDHLIIYYKLHIESFGNLRSLEILRSIL